MLTAVTIFAATYLLVSARRLGLLPLGRPGAAMLGAVACVMASVLTPKQALAAIDGHTLVLLFGMMGMGAFLALDGFPERAQSYIARRVRTRARLLSLLVYGSGIGGLGFWAYLKVGFPLALITTAIGTAWLLLLGLLTLPSDQGAVRAKTRGS